MPYRHAHWWILGLFPLSGVAFWPSYVSSFSTAPASYHFHGITATLWLILLAIQSWSIHHGKRAFHRTNGLVSFALFPLFLAGGSTIFIGMAQRHVQALSPFYELWPASLAWYDFVSVGGMAYFYYMALKHRRSVEKHAAYMLATPIFLLPPILGRLAPLPMGLDFAKPGAFEQLGTGFQLAQVLTALIAFAIAARSPRTGRPFVIAGLLSLLGVVLFHFVGGSAMWKSIFPMAATIPMVPFAAGAAIFGAVVGWAGWIAGKRPAPTGPEPLPA
jgi:hypothetical protein